MITSKPGAQNLLTSTPDAAVLGICCALTSAKDLLSLKLTCRRFVAAAVQCASIGASQEATRSFVDEAARQWLVNCSEQERGWVPDRTVGGGAWMRRMHEVEMLRVPLRFGRAHTNVKLSLCKGESVATKTASDHHYRDASTHGAVMRSGRHFARCTVAAAVTCPPLVGVIRSDWAVGIGEEQRAFNQVFETDGHCFYSTKDGHRFPRHVEWDGMAAAKEQGDRIGLLLDLDQGSMTVWKNETKLGVMQSEGLRGEFCWAVSLYSQGDSVHIEPAPAPPSPNEQELAAAKAGEGEGRLDPESSDEASASEDSI
jgi:hypothetical protein